MTTLQRQGGHHKVRGREEVQKLLGEGLFRKSKTKQSGRVGKQPKWLQEIESLRQTAGRPYVPTGAMVHDDNDAVFVDLTKAFDTVFHEGLRKVLGKCECPSKFINLVKALHDKMQVHVPQGTYIFKEFAVTNDVKHGSMLAPTLFALYRTAMLEVAFDSVGNSIYIQTHTNPDLSNVTHNPDPSEGDAVCR